MLRELIRSEHVKNAIIFCNRKRDVAILLKSLLKHGFNAGALHGDMDQMSRMATLDAFREGRITLLAASDVAARGLDIPDVSHIFNFDVPWQSDDYVHRIGRTGRAGKEGRSLTLVTPDDFRALKDIEKMLGAPVTWIGDAPSEEDIASGSQAPSRRSPRARRPADRRVAPSRAAGSSGGRFRNGSHRPERNGAATRPHRPEREDAPAVAANGHDQPQPALQPRSSQQPAQERARIGTAASTRSEAPGEPAGRARTGGPSAGGAAPSAPRRPQTPEGRETRAAGAPGGQAAAAASPGQAGPPALGAASAALARSRPGRPRAVAGRPRRPRAGLPEEDHAHGELRPARVSPGISRQRNIRDPGLAVSGVGSTLDP